MNRRLIKPVYPFSSGSLLTDHCSGAFLKEIARAASLTIVLGITVVLATGCSSTEKGFNTRLISPVTRSQATTDAEENSIYQPARSPGFNDFFGS
jgi:hypothetical protein